MHPLMRELSSLPMNALSSLEMELLSVMELLSNMELLSSLVYPLPHEIELHPSMLMHPLTLDLSSLLMPFL